MPVVAFMSSEAIMLSWYAAASNCGGGVLTGGPGACGSGS
jgi:hypothetical protein